MSRKAHKRDVLQARERLAHMGLAADPVEPGEPCPDDSQFSALLEAEPGSAEQARFFEHLSRCESCFQKWMALTEVLGEPAETRSQPSTRWKRRRLVGAVGSACGLALGVMLYLSIDQRPPRYDAADLSSGPAAVVSPPSPGPPADDNSADPDVGEQTPDAVFSGEAGMVEKSRSTRTSAELPALAKQKMAESQAAPESGGAAGSIMSDDDERLADTAAEVSSPATMDRDRERTDFSTRESAAGAISFVDFAGSLVDLCTTGPETVVSEDLWQPILDTGRLLLGSKRLGEGENRELVEKSVRLLEKEKAIDDKEWSELCEHARRLLPQPGGPHSRQ